MTLVYTEIDNKYIHLENGTSYYKGTDIKVMHILERIRKDHIRIKLSYGDINTGRDWNETNDIYGYVGRTCGKIKIPILLHNNNSMGGGTILTDCIVKIEYANKKNGKIIYKHPRYHNEEV